MLRQKWAEEGVGEKCDPRRMQPIKLSLNSNHSIMLNLYKTDKNNNKEKVDSGLVYNLTDFVSIDKEDTSILKLNGLRVNKSISKLLIQITYYLFNMCI